MGEERPGLQVSPHLRTLQGGEEETAGLHVRRDQGSRCLLTSVWTCSVRAEAEVLL